MLLELGIGAAVGGLGNLLSKSSAVNAQKKRLNAYRNAIQKMKLSDSSINQRVDEVGDAYNTQMMDELNKSGVGLAIQGGLNPGNVRASIGSKMLGQRATAMMEFRNKMLDYNRGLEAKLAESNLEEPDSVNFGDFAQGALGGAMIGAEISKITSPPKVDDPTKIIEGIGGGVQDTGIPTNNVNPYIPNVPKQNPIEVGRGVMDKWTGGNVSNTIKPSFERQTPYSHEFAESILNRANTTAVDIKNIRGFDNGIIIEPMKEVNQPLMPQIPMDTITGRTEAGSLMYRTSEHGQGINLELKNRRRAEQEGKYGLWRTRTEQIEPGKEINSTMNTFPRTPVPEFFGELSNEQRSKIPMGLDDILVSKSLRKNKTKAGKRIGTNNFLPNVPNTMIRF